jgi:hypothetical protein
VFALDALDEIATFIHTRADAWPTPD